jgi:hypothetical protein
MPRDKLQVKKVLETKEYGPLLLRRELVDDSEYGGTGALEMRNAYTRAGDYVGDWKMAQMLWDEHRIVPQNRTPDSQVTTVGYSERDNKWFGWSHRAIQGFGVGDKKFTNEEEEITTIDEAQQEAMEFAESVR